MSNKLKTLFQELTEILNEAEKRYRGIYENAIYIDDFSEAQSISNEAQRNIIQIREWKIRIDILAEDIYSKNIIQDINIEQENKIDSTDNEVKVEALENISEPVIQTEEVIINTEPPKLDEQKISENIVESESAGTVKGKKPKQMKLLGMIREIGNWNELYLNVCEIMLLYKPYIIAGFDKDSELNTEKRIKFSYIENDIKYHRKRLSNGLWIETNMNADDCLGLSYRVLEKCGYNHDDLTILLRED